MYIYIYIYIYIYSNNILKACYSIEKYFNSFKNTL